MCWILTSQTIHPFLFVCQAENLIYSVPHELFPFSLILNPRAVLLSNQNVTASVFSCDCNALHVVFISWASILADINSNRAIESSLRGQLSFCLPLTSHGPVHRLYVTQSKPSHSTLFYSHLQTRAKNTLSRTLLSPHTNIY